MKIDISLNKENKLKQTKRSVVKSKTDALGYLYGWLVGFYGISTIVGYLMPYLFLLLSIVLFQII